MDSLYRLGLYSQFVSKLPLISFSSGGISVVSMRNQEITIALTHLTAEWSCASIEEHVLAWPVLLPTDDFVSSTTSQIERSQSDSRFEG